MIRPLTLDTMRKSPEGSQMSPTGITPSFGNFSFTPPQSATEVPSPVSAGPEMSPFGFGTSHMDNNRRPSSNPFGAGNGPARPSYLQPGQIPRLHDRVQRSRADSVSSPLRTSISYSTSDYSGANNTVTCNDPPQMNMKERSQSNPMLPYGLGQGCMSTSHCDIVLKANNGVDSSVPGFQSAASSRMRSFSHAPKRIELNQFTSNSSPAVPQTATFSNYQSSPFDTQSFEPPPLSAPHNISSFHNPYLHHNMGSNDDFSQMGSVTG